MIKINNLFFNYGSADFLFKNINLNFEKGNIYGIVGENGSGKTTLLNILSGLIVNYKGEVEIDSVSSKKRNESYLKNFFYIPENMFDFDMRIRDFVTLGKSYQNFDENKFKKIISKTDIKMSDKFSKLSKGWKKRVYIYFGLSINTDILLLDEVSEGIDIVAQKELIKYLLEYFDDNKIIILSSHHIEEFDRIIDSFIVVKDGGIVLNEKKDNIQSNYGIVEEEYKESIKESDIIKSDDFMGKKYYIIKNRGDYDNIDISNIEIKDFLELIIKKEV